MNQSGRRLRVVLTLAIALGSSPRAVALVVVPPATNDNTTAPTPEPVPADNPAWLNVGDNGVYIGNRWVLTAVHVGALPTRFPGVAGGAPFAVEPGSAIPLTNPAIPGLTTNTDLMLYRLTADPGLPPLTFASSTPAPGDLLYLIGDGRAVSPGDMESHWNVTINNPDDYTWTPSGPAGNFHGYISTSERKLWGTNVAEDDEALENDGDPDNTVAVNAEFGDVISFYTDFDDPTSPDATSAEAQAMFHDSGSAIFSRENGRWVLAGLTHAISIFPNQPGGTSTAVYGNLTFAADLATYATQIMAITVPEAGGFLLVGGAGALAAVWRLGATRRPRNH